MEKIKSVPIPIWIGLGLILIVIFVMNSKAGAAKAPPKTAPVGPVTDATVGTQGSQRGAGTDQQLGNLSVLTQGGISQILQQEQANNALMTGIANRMNGVGTPMQQFGGAIQATQNGSAQTNALNGTAGQNSGINPLPVPPRPD